MTDKALSPIIIIGMHRSGTSMITRLLEELGLFVGRRTQRNREALFFFHLNEWVFRQAGAAWDHPGPVRNFLEHGEVRELTRRYIKRLLHSPRLVSYLGWDHYLLGRRLDHLRFPWGWKDPRNTWTAPLWFDLFPEARVIHVVRHGVDVAQSLRRRHHRLLELRRDQATGGALRLLIRPKRDGFTDSIRCASLEGGFSLWEEYLAEARRRIAGCENESMEVRFEDFLDSPREALDGLIRFCGLTPSRNRIESVSAGVRNERAFAFRGDPELRAFAEGAADKLAREGYEAAPDRGNGL